jgi:flagellar M-ring protein FliF
MGSLRSILANTTPKGRLVLAASAVGVVLFAFFMMRLASAPSYATVLTGMDPAETGKVTAALDAKGVKYEIQNNGTALAVDKSPRRGFRPRASRRAWSCSTTPSSARATSSSR